MVCLHSLHAVYHSDVMVIHAGHIMKDGREEEAV